MERIYPIIMRGTDHRDRIVVEFVSLTSGKVLESNMPGFLVGRVYTELSPHTNNKVWELLEAYKPQDTSDNNGGKTAYYQLSNAPFPINDFDDFAEWRGLNGNQFNIGKAVWAFNVGRHSGTDYLRDLNKIIHYANREKLRLSREAQNVDK